MFGKKKQYYDDRKQFSWNELEERMKSLLLNILGKSGESQEALVKELQDLVGPKVEIPKLQKQLAELKLDREIEERDIKHLVKMKEEKLAIEHQKSELTLKSEYKEKEMVLQREYHEKIMNQLDLARTEMKQVYRDIMACLPNVNMQIVNENQAKAAPEAKKAD